MSAATRPRAAGPTRWLFGLVYFALLSGTITTQRISASLPNVEVRLPLAYLCVAGYLLWVSRQPRVVGAGRARSYALGLVLLFLLMAVSAAWAPVGSAPGEDLVDFALMAVLVLIAIDIVVRAPAVIGDLWWYLLASGLLYLAASVATGAGSQGRYSALGGGPNVYVRVVSLGAIAAVVLAVRSKRMRFLVVALLLMAGAILSGSRGGIAALGIVSVVAVLPYLRKIGSAALFRASVIAVASGALVYALLGRQVIAEFQSRVIVETLQDGYDSNRSNAYRDAWNLFLAHPLGGAGLGGFYQDVGQYTGLVYPHNLELGYLSEGGIVAALLLAGLLVRPYLSYRLARDVSIECRGLWWCSLYMFIASQFSGGYYDARFMWLFMAATIVASIPSIGSAAVPEARSPHVEDDLSSHVPRLSGLAVLRP